MISDLNLYVRGKLCPEVAPSPANDLVPRYFETSPMLCVRAHTRERVSLSMRMFFFWRGGGGEKGGGGSNVLGEPKFEEKHAQLRRARWMA